MMTPTTPSGDLDNPSGDILLEKIMEEDSSYCDERTQGITSPTSNDKKHLLGNGHHLHSVTITKI